jgi:hypothetical protein
MIQAGKCCCCCSLKTGAIIIGVIFLIFGLFRASSASVGLSGDDFMEDATWFFVITDLDDNADDRVVINDGEGKVVIDDGEGKVIIIGPKWFTDAITWIKDARAKVTKDEATALLVVDFIFGILEIIAASSLLFGVSNINASFVLPILFLIPVDQAVRYISFLVIVGFNPLIFISMVIPSLLVIYFWVCLFSYWKEMKEEVKSNPVP